MPFESNLKRKTLDNNYRVAGTLEDHQDAERDGSNFDFIVKAGLIGAGLFGLYKTGALKPAMKSIYEYGAKLAKKPEDFLFSKGSALESWSKFDGMSKNMKAKLGVEDVNLPGNSLFRNKKLDVLKTIINDAYDSAKGGSVDFSRTQTIIKDTKNDIDILKTITEKQKKITGDYMTKYKDTSLVHSMKNLKEFYQEVDYKLEGSGHLAKSKALEAFMENNTLTEQERSLQLKRKGLRNVTLDDLFEAPDTSVKDEFGRTDLKLKEKMKDQINLLDEQAGNSTYESIRYFIQDPMKRIYDDQGSRNLLVGWDKTKNMILDRGIYINDETGEIVDTRMTKAFAKEVGRSFSSNFQIPGLGFNPIGSLFPDLARGGQKIDSFGIIQKDRIDPVLTKMGGRTTVGDVFGDDIVVINGNAFKSTSMFRPEDIIETGLNLNDITYRETTGLNKMSDSIRRIAGLDFKELSELSQEDVEKLSAGKRFYYDMSRWLDFGASDLDAKAKREFLKKTKSINPDDFEDFYGYFNPDQKVFGEWIKDFLSNDMVQPPRTISGEHTYDDIFGKGFGVVVDDVGNKKLFREYLTSKQTYILSDVKNGDKTLKEWGAQFFAGRDKYNNISDNFTERSANIYGNVNNIEEKVASLAKPIGLSNESKKSTGDIFKNIMLKRVLPIYALLQLPGQIDALSEPIFELFGANDEEDNEAGNRMNLSKFFMSNIVKPVDVGFHVVKDTLGITNVAKTFDEFMPGFDQITEFPGLNALGLTQTTEERKEWMEKGLDPVRKGRYWGLGNTPFTGGKIMYYRPNVYRRVAADVDFSDSKWGSRKEYYDNTWYPNFVNPFAPINHFILDKNHYDKKHYKDRPYLQTSPAGANVPIVGPLFSSTVGTLISPPQRMHQDYWENGKPIMRDDEQGIGEIIENQQAQAKNFVDTINQSFVDTNTIQSTYTKAKTSEQNMATYRTFDVERSKKLVETPISANSGVLFSEYKITPKTSINPSQSDLEVYSTPSGSMSIVDIPDDMTTYEANQELKRYSIKKFQEANTRPDINEFSPIVADYSDLKMQNGFLTGLKEEYNTLTDLFGMKGFELQAFVTGEANAGIATVENSSYAYSFNKEFWDQNLGGLGDNFSEMFRRFVQRRNNNIEYINPVRNTMPSWMPGRNYFTDFKHGDPYSKVDNGEERLPGEGYERLYDIDMKKILSLGIGSSYIGKTSEDIQKHLLNADDPFTSFAQDVTEKGTAMHEEIEKQWMESGYAISVEGKIEDKQNNILGFYDAKVHDPESKTGYSFFDIKTVSDKKFKQVVKENKPFYENKSQVNYYLWATGNTEALGGIYYVNRDDPTKTHTVKFKFDQNLLKENLTNLEVARQNIYKGLKDGSIGRGELYPTLDRLRVLADVAPYSEEYRQTMAKLSTEKLSPEEQEEVSKIRDRISKQKEPLRVYDYKFKTSNLSAQKVRVKKMVDNNSILVDMNGKQQVVKFAGINVKSSDSEKYNEDLSFKKAAQKELKKHIKKGRYITILHDADEEKLYNKDSTRSIKAVVEVNGKNINRTLLKKGLATEKENDDTPAGIRARYSKREIAFGSTMEKLTHGFSNNVPYFGSKFLNVKSPYEAYKKKEVYGKDFQSWNHPIRDFLIPTINEQAEKPAISGIMLGAFIGSLFGKKGNIFGKIVGAGIGASVALTGKMYAEYEELRTGKKWIPQRRKDQREVNEYMDTLKYVKNIRLYENYKQKALKEDKVNVDKLIGSKQGQGVLNKERKRDLEHFKKQVKLDYKHRKSYNFKYGKPEGIDLEADQKTIISQINKELTTLSSDRSLMRTSDNVVKALSYYQQAQETMYAFDRGDSLQNYLKALPKKDRQYYKYFVDAPEEEKDKILEIAPSYLRRGLQAAWGRDVEDKPTLEEFFSRHALPDESWVGWNEETNLEDVKVKLVHQNKLDPGEFDIWDDQIDSANSVNIPIPDINKQSDSISTTKRKLMSLLGQAGYTQSKVDVMQSNRNNVRFNVKQDKRDSIEDAMGNMNI